MPSGTRTLASGRCALALAATTLTLLTGCGAAPPALESVRAVAAAERTARADARVANAPTTTATTTTTAGGRTATAPATAGLRSADRAASTATSARRSATPRPTSARPRPSATAERKEAAPARPAATSSRAAAPDGRTLRATVTFYAAYDNDPPGSRAIAYPNELHAKAGGTGTYDDPITFASAEGTIPVGTRLYYPPLQKYFVMEDQCATCGDAHVDLYAGSATDSGVLACEEALTPGGRVAVELDPPAGRPVDTTPLYDDGRCITG